MIDEAVQQLVQQTIQQMLPQIVAAVVQQMPAAAPAPAAAFGGFGAPAPAANPAPSAFGGFGAPAANPAPATPAAATPEMVQAVIIPHINGPHGEQAKMAFGQQMQAMGIANLQDATAAQLPELYQRFQQVAAQLAQMPAPGAAAPSII